MNFSTISNKSTLENQTINALSHDELVETYSQLKVQFDHLSKSHDRLKQDYYDAKRSYETAVEVQEHLNTEVDTVQKSEIKLKWELNKKIQQLQDSAQTHVSEKSEISEMYEKQLTELKIQVKKLEDRDSNESENVWALQDQIKVLTEDCRSLMNEKVELKDLIEKQNDITRSSADAVQALQAKIESLTSEMEFLKSNLDYKKEELDSANDLVNSAQEEVCMLKVELQSLKADSSKHASKGNSLFAEVEDKRQEMILSLTKMREKYNQLKIDYANRQKEVDDLLREKKRLWAEYEGLASHQDAVLLAGYENRITDLERVCEEQRREINTWYSKNLNPNSSELEQWITGVLAHKSEQCLHLSDELAACSVNCLAKEKKIRQLHSQLSNLRFKVSANENPKTDQSYNGEVTSVGTYRPISSSGSKCVDSMSDSVDSNRQSLAEI